MKKIAKFLESHPLIRILDSLSKLGIIFAVLFWLFELDDRAEERDNLRKQNIYRAWDIINSSELMPQSPIRKFAFEDLLKENFMPEGIDLRQTPMDGPDFEGISFKSSYLAFLSFNNSNLIKANFDYTYLEDVSFNNADLKDASFYGSVINNVDFTNSQGLESVDFSNALILDSKGLNTKNYVPDSLVINKIRNLARKPSDWLDEEEIDTILHEIKTKRLNKLN